jgi:hypothetical protein
MSDISAGGEKSGRCDPAYFERMLEIHFARSQTPVFGVEADFPPPETFDELLVVVESARNPECGVSEEVDSMVELIGVMPDRDEIVSRLPYNPRIRSLAFIIPEEF